MEKVLKWITVFLVLLNLAAAGFALYIQNPYAFTIGLLGAWVAFKPLMESSLFDLQLEFDKNTTKALRALGDGVFAVGDTVATNKNKVNKLGRRLGYKWNGKNWAKDNKKK